MRRLWTERALDMRAILRRALRDFKDVVSLADFKALRRFCVVIIGVVQPRLITENV